MSTIIGKDLTQYHGRGGLGRIKANSSNVLQLANKNGGYAELAAGTYTLPTLDSGQEMFWFFVKATGAVTITGAGPQNTLASGDVGKVVMDGSGWTMVNFTTLESLYNKATSSFGHVDIPLHSFREVDADGDVSNIAANGGILASDTAPIMEGAGTTNAQRINWATGNVDRIASSVTLPRDFDGTQQCQVGVVLASGATNGFDATVITNWNGGADVSDTMIDDPSATVHRTEVTVAAADIPDDAMSVSVSFTPPAHASDAYHLYGVYLRYNKKLIEA